MSNIYLVFGFMPLSRVGVFFFFFFFFFFLRISGVGVFW